MSKNIVKIRVGMASCGIAAGARPVLNTLVEEVNNSGLADKITVSQTGCIGMCFLEPIVDIYDNENRACRMFFLDLTQTPQKFTEARIASLACTSVMRTVH